MITIKRSQKQGTGRGRRAETESVGKGEQGRKALGKVVFTNENRKE